ncbi:unnamed protein product [Trichobilharzia szidati]|nr:unnamed protein product [Trichobilharzia szidati]
MFVEIAVTVNYILSHLYTKLPRRRVDSFGEELEKYLQAKFQHHWFPNDPLRDSAYRCINCVGPQVDLLLPEAAAVSGLEWSEIEACLPDGLIISVDPGHVACQYNQTNCSIHDRFSSNHWPSSSVSLSSSGCSSASSSISSSNLTSVSSQTTHQVLYCLQDAWPTSITSMQSENRQDPFSTKHGRSENDHGDLLATAAALSVLVEPDEVNDTKIESSAAYGVKLPVANHTNWSHENVSMTNHEELSKIQLNEVDFKPLNALHTERCNEKEAVSSFPWNFSEGRKGPSLLSVLDSDSIGGTPSTTQSVVFNVKTHTFPLFHRSSSNPPQSAQLTNPHFNEFIALSANCVNSNLLSSKFDQPMNSVFTHTSPKSFPTYLQPVNTTVSTHPFVQKSTSTPSFTAATFAQTKFGSTKLKNHTKRTPTRILSPTTVQQSLAPVNNTSFLSNETAAANGFLVNNSRIEASNTTNLSAFQCFLPMNIEINTSKPANCLTISGSTLPTHNECRNINLHHDNGNSIPSFHQRNMCNNFALSNLENYLSYSSEETSPNSVLDRIHLNEVHNIQNVSNYWQSSSYEKQIQPSNIIQTAVATTTTTDGTVLKSGIINFNNLGLCTNWNTNSNTSSMNSDIFNVSSNQMMNSDFKSNIARLLPTSVSTASVIEQQPVQQKINVNLDEIICKDSMCTPSSTNNKGNDCLLDDVMLSTRMVNLLLEEDNLNESQGNNILTSHLQEEDYTEGFTSGKNDLFSNTVETDAARNNIKICSADTSHHEAIKDLSTGEKYKESNLVSSVTSIANDVTESVLNTEAV